MEGFESLNHFITLEHVCLGFIKFGLESLSSSASAFTYVMDPL